GGQRPVEHEFAQAVVGGPVDPGDRCDEVHAHPSDPKPPNDQIRVICPDNRVMPSRRWGQDTLSCPLPITKIKNMQTHARRHPWRGDTALTCPDHAAETSAILEPGRTVRI